MATTHLKTLRSVKFAVSICAFLSFQSASVAASFDCSKAKTNHEKFICSNPEVNEADFQLGVAYRQAIKIFKYSDLIRREHRRWLSSYRKCHVEKNCLQMIGDRINELNVWKNARIYTTYPRGTDVLLGEGTIILFGESVNVSARFVGYYLPPFGLDPDAKGPDLGNWCDWTIDLVKNGRYFVPKDEEMGFRLYVENDKIVMEGNLTCSARNVFQEGVYKRY